MTPATLAGVGAAHEGEAAGVEEAAVAVDGLVVVFGGDDGVIGAVAGDFGLQRP